LRPVPFLIPYLLWCIGRRIRYQPTMQMMDDEQPHTIKNTLNKYTIKGMELRKELVSTIMEMMFPK
jgi:hypothetical protein